MRATQAPPEEGRPAAHEPVAHGAVAAELARGVPLARILLATAGQTVSEHELHPGRLIIGRTSANDLQIDSRFVSRHHCQIVTTAQNCVIEDLNSTNGIYLQSKRIRYHNLNDGDVITIGQHELLYIDERARVHRTGDHPHIATNVLPEKAPEN